MITPSLSLAEEDWDELLIDIENRQVIPVIGPELVTVPDDTGGRIPLVRWLAPRLAERLELQNTSEFTTLNDTARMFLLGGGDRRKIYSALRMILKDKNFEPPEALMQLAKIKDFDLLITSTFDPLLADAMQKERAGFASSRDVLVYDTKPSSLFPDPLPSSIVYHILGNINTYPDFAVWEEDYMEYLCHLIEHSREAALEGLFRQLRSRHLLLLGAPFSDWIVRFFIRAARGSRLTARRNNDTRETIADHHINVGEPTVFFFNHLAQSTRVLDGNPTVFVEELFKRWLARRDKSGSEKDFLCRMANEIPKNSIFISYSHDDSESATCIAMALAEANIPVWMDKERLHVGQDYERNLEHAVRDACGYFISIISNATESDSKRYVHKERAWAEKRFLEGFVFYLPIIIDDTDVPKLEPICFNKIHCERVSDGRPSEAFIQRLRKYIEDLRTSGRPRD